MNIVKCSYNKTQGFLLMCLPSSILALCITFTEKIWGEIILVVSPVNTWTYYSNPFNQKHFSTTGLSICKIWPYCKIWLRIKGYRTHHYYILQLNLWFFLLPEIKLQQACTVVLSTVIQFLSLCVLNFVTPIWWIKRSLPMFIFFHYSTKITTRGYYSYMTLIATSLRR